MAPPSEIQSKTTTQ
jgi:hypothetical protein